MVDEGYMEVYFDQYCKRCKHWGESEFDDPCNECLCEPANLHSHKPVNFEKNPKYKELTEDGQETNN